MGGFGSYLSCPYLHCVTIVSQQFLMISLGNKEMLKECGWCGINQIEARKLISSGFVCDTCIGLMVDIIREEVDPMFQLTVDDGTVTKAEHDYWFGEFKKALVFLKQGKLKFAPHTTNSDVDYFIEKHEHLLLEGSDFNKPIVDGVK